VESIKTAYTIISQLVQIQLVNMEKVAVNWPKGVLLPCKMISANNGSTADDAHGSYDV